ERLGVRGVEYFGCTPRCERSGRCLHRDRREPVFQIEIEQLLSVSRPDRPCAAARRRLPSSTCVYVRERPHVDLIPPRLVRLVREVAPVWRELRVAFDERGTDERLRRAG